MVPASAWSRWLFLSGALFVGFCFVAVFSGLLRTPAPPSAPIDPASVWDGAHTFECTGKQLINLNNVHAKVKGVAIHADGRCNLSITGGTITADTIIVASGHALVSLDNLVIDAPIVVDASENAQIVLFRTRVKGKLMTRDQASVREL
jgi:hypothetical protein